MDGADRVLEWSTILNGVGRLLRSISGEESSETEKSRPHSRMAVNWTSPQSHPDGLDALACQPGGGGVPLALSKLEDTEFRDAGDGATDATGQLFFEDLAAGTYRLRGRDIVWCHAEPDVVDAQGDLIVTAGRHVSVWVFLCDEDAVK